MQKNYIEVGTQLGLETLGRLIRVSKPKIQLTIMAFTPNGIIIYTIL